MRDLVGGPGGQAGASLPWGCKGRAKAATGKRPTAQRVFQTNSRHPGEPALNGGGFNLGRKRSCETDVDDVATPE